MQGDKYRLSAVFIQDYDEQEFKTLYSRKYYSEFSKSEFMYLYKHLLTQIYNVLLNTSLPEDKAEVILTIAIDLHELALYSDNGAFYIGISQDAKKLYMSTLFSDNTVQLFEVLNLSRICRTGCQTIISLADKTVTVYFDI